MKKYKVLLTLREIALIVRLRKVDFGVVEVHKSMAERDTDLTRTIIKKNELLNEVIGRQALEEIGGEVE